MAQITVTQSAEDAFGAPSLTGVTSGRVLVAVICALPFFGNTPNVSSVSGGTGTWTEVAAQEQSGKGCWIWVGTGNTASSVTLSVTVANLGGGGFAAVLYELSADADAFDVGSADGNTADESTFDSGTTATLASDEGLAIGGVVVGGFGNSVTWDSPWVEDFDARIGAIDARYSSAHLEVTSTSGVAASGTYGSAHSWAATVAVIKPAAGGGPTEVPLPSLLQIKKPIYLDRPIRYIGL